MDNKLAFIRKDVDTQTDNDDGPSTIFDQGICVI